MRSKQVNISLPQSWLDQLQRIARIQSVQEDKTITYLDLIRSAIQEKFSLDAEGLIVVSIGSKDNPATTTDIKQLSKSLKRT